MNHLIRLVAGADFAFVHQFRNQEIIRDDLVAAIEELYSQDDEINTQAVG